MSGKPRIPSPPWAKKKPSRARKPRAADPEPSAELDDFGPAVAAEVAEDLAMPPPPPAPDAAPPEPPSASLVALGSPPADHLQAQDWMYRVLLASAHDAISDARITAAARRRELRTIAAAAAAVLPKSRIWEAEQMIRGDAKQLEAGPRGAPLEPVPEDDGVDPRP